MVASAWLWGPQHPCSSLSTEAAFFFCLFYERSDLRSKRWSRFADNPFPPKTTLMHPAKPASKQARKLWVGGGGGVVVAGDPHASACFPLRGPPPALVGAGLLLLRPAELKFAMWVHSGQESANQRRRRPFSRPEASCSQGQRRREERQSIPGGGWGGLPGAEAVGRGLEKSLQQESWCWVRGGKGWIVTFMARTMINIFSY